MKAVDNYKMPTKSSVQIIAEKQGCAAKMYKNRLGTDKKLEQDLNDIFGNYDPAVHIVGVKATYDHKHEFKDRQTRTVQYVAGNVVADPKKFDPTPTCGGGLHFSFGHDEQSMRNTLMSQVETGTRFHIGLLNVSEAVLVGSDKLKVPSADLVFTGSFKDCHRLLKALFGLANAPETIVKKV